MTLTVTFDLLQGQICCRAGDHNSLNLLVFSKFVFGRRCTSLIVTNLHADRIISPYFRCYALRAFLNILAPNFTFCCISLRTNIGIIKETSTKMHTPIKIGINERY